MEITFSGEPPFWIEYEVRKERANAPGSFEVQSTERKPGYQKPRTTLQFEPTASGTYQYLFKRVGDRNYEAGVALSLEPITQTFHPHSSARFAATQATRLVLCRGDPFTLDVEVTGSGPWTLNYALLHKGRVDPLSTTISQSKPVIRLPFEGRDDSGTYIVELLEIVDANVFIQENLMLGVQKDANGNGRCD